MNESKLSGITKVLKSVSLNVSTFLFILIKQK